MTRTSNFLGSISDEKLLNQITVPGSHDAGVYEGETSGLLKGFAIAQDRDIGKQCRGGSRFFDVRIKDGRADHGGYKSASLEKILGDVVSFLKSENGRSEFVILRFSKSNRQNEIIDMVKGIGTQYLFDFETNIATTRLGAVRGQIIAAFAADAIVKKRHFRADKVKEQFGTYIDPENGIHSFKKRKGAIGAGDKGLFTCGVYSKSPSIEDVWTGQLERAEEHHNHDDDRHLSVLYWTLTQRKGYQSQARNIGKLTKGSVGTHQKSDDLMAALKQQAKLNMDNNRHELVLNPEEVHEAKGVRRGAGMPRPKLPNVIMYDFVNPATSVKIIRLNERWLQM